MSEATRPVPVHLMLFRQDGAVRLKQLDHAAWRFCAHVAQGETLAESWRASGESFGLAQLLADLFGRGLVSHWILGS